MIPVSQSMPVEKSPTKVRVTVIESVGSGVLGSSTRNGGSVSRPLFIWSVTCNEFCQLNEPIRSGVSRLSAVARLLPVWSIVSSTPPGRTCTSGFRGVLEVVLLVKLSPGDQVMFEPRSIEAGEIVSAGSSCWTLPSERLCRRLPPSVTVPQP